MDHQLLLSNESTNKSSGTNNIILSSSDQFDFFGNHAGNIWSSHENDDQFKNNQSLVYDNSVNISQQHYHQNHHIPINVQQATSFSPSCNTFLTNLPIQTSTQAFADQQSQLRPHYCQPQQVVDQLGNVTNHVGNNINTPGAAFIQNNQNTLVQNNTNLIQPINLVNIGPLPNNCHDNGIGSGRNHGNRVAIRSSNSIGGNGGFLIMRDGKLQYVPNTIGSQSSISLPSIQCMLNSRSNANCFESKPASDKKRKDKFTVSHSASGRSGNNASARLPQQLVKKKQRPLKPKPVTSALMPKAILPRQSNSSVTTTNISSNQLLYMASTAFTPPSTTVRKSQSSRTRKKPKTAKTCSIASTLPNLDNSIVHPTSAIPEQSIINTIPQNYSHMQNQLSNSNLIMYSNQQRIFQAQQPPSNFFHFVSGKVGPAILIEDSKAIAYIKVDDNLEMLSQQAIPSQQYISKLYEVYYNQMNVDPMTSSITVHKQESTQNLDDSGKSSSIVKTDKN
ncbi:hypothetical protein GJ496_000985 [Pomphorhynchus laevis]|nr:hypothetical protein GJ496_000985 [Pomphorhynchus laevis]